MAFDKEAYWKEKNARKIAGKAALAVKLATRIVCRRCKGSTGQLIKGTFFCINLCDQNSLWDRIVGFFGFGNWRVVYLDGQRSTPLPRRAAEKCREDFGGLLLRTKARITHRQFGGIGI